MTGDFLRQLRLHELVQVFETMTRQGRLLEIGAGPGVQAHQLQALGFEVEALDLPDSNYRHERVFPIIDYDGFCFPFPDSSFDIVFSSNVLEHVVDLNQLNSEIARVLRPGGTCLHVLPTASWRLWTTLSAFPLAVRRFFEERGWRRVSRMCRTLGYALTQRRHGERGNVWTEAWYFRAAWWRRNFAAAGFQVISEQPVGLFYTGHTVLGLTFSFRARTRLAYFIGSSTRVYQMRHAGQPACHAD